HATAHRHRHAGHTYYFCSAGCRSKFAADPDRYVDSPTGRGTDDAPVAQDAIYTCPMHPQIRQVRPGSCPICGMALQPQVAAASGGSPELREMSRRFWISLALAVPVVALEMGGHIANLHMLIAQRSSNWIQFLLATPIVLWGGSPFFARGWQSLLTRNLNM